MVVPLVVSGGVRLRAPGPPPAADNPGWAAFPTPSDERVASVRQVGTTGRTDRTLKGNTSPVLYAVALPEEDATDLQLKARWSGARPTAVASEGTANAPPSAGAQAFVRSRCKTRGAPLAFSPLRSAVDWPWP